MDRSQLAPTALSVNSRVQLSKPAQLSSIPPSSPTRDRLMRIM
jgi:hypothetical protein